MFLSNIINNWSVSKKITSLIAASAVITGAAAGFGVSKIASNFLSDYANDDMTKIAAASSQRVDTYLGGIKDDLLANAQSTFTADIITEFNDGWNNIQTDQKTYLQKHYIEKNPHPAGEKDKLYNSPDGSYYSDVHQKYHSHFMSNKDNKGYYDIFLFNTNGELIYSVFKELDYATNIVSGQWASSDLGTIFKEIKENPTRGKVSFTDFSPYGPSADAPASFIGAPVFNKAEKFVGVIAYQMPVDRFNSIFNMQDKQRTSYLVGTDGLLRSDNELTKNNDILSTKARIANLNDFSGKTITNQPGLGFEASDYAIDIVNFLGVKWYSVVEMNSEYLAHKKSVMVYIASGLSLFVSVIVGVIGFLLSKKISRPLSDLSNTVDKLAQGYAVTIPNKERGDEIGSLARSLTAIYDQSVASQRVETAVEESRSSLMIADMAGKIIYNNKTIFNKLDASREFLNKKFPNINIDNLKDNDITDFYGNKKSEIDALLKKNQATHNSEISFDNRYFDTTIRPVFDKSNNHLGFVGEWREKTGEILAQIEEAKIKENEQHIEIKIAEVIQDAASGNFKTKLDIQKNDRQFIKSVSEGINQICSSVDEFFQELNGTVSSFADGDLTKNLNGCYTGQFEEVKINLNNSFRTLSDTIKQISMVGNGIRSASGDITQGADDLSSRTEAQAASIEETVATMEEISASVRNNANSAVQASSLAAETLSQAEEGSRVVSQAVEAMGGLENSSHRIAEIVSVIDSIASQTNLLALNAAVEAARAGEAGKGFAVVASEVRTLASRCSEAARDIRGLITGSNTQVVDGVKLVSATGAALRQIVESVTDVSQTISAISSASREQATGVEEISGAISQMDEMTQQNASLSDESATAARSLSKEAEQLAQLIRHFKTENAESILASVSKELEAEQVTLKPKDDFNDFGMASGDDWSDI